MARKRRENVIEHETDVKAGGGFAGAKKCMKRTDVQLPKSGGIEESYPPLDSAEALSAKDHRKTMHLKDSAEKLPMLDLCSGKVLHPPEKMKLQLFPVDEGTREGLEKDGFHPYLELTLSSRKKISSVLKHLDNKWGSSRIAQGEPTLYPYDKLAHLTGYKWSTNNGLTAGDVYAAIGSPAVFRLRYGWFCDIETMTSGMPCTSTPSEACFQSESKQKSCSTETERMYRTGEQITGETDSFARPSAESEATNPAFIENPDGPGQSKDDDMKDECSGPTTMLWDDGLTNISIGGLLSEASLKGRFSNCGKNSNVGDTTLWDDSLTNISIGGLLSEASLQGRLNNCDQRSNRTNACLQDDNQPNIGIGGLLSEGSLRSRFNVYDKTSNTSGTSMQPSPLISDSFDAFLMGQTNQSQGPCLSTPEPCSSILDAEDTCHAFSFQKLSSSWKDAVSKGGNGRSSTPQMTQDGAESFKTLKKNQASGQAEPLQEHASQTHLLPSSQVFNQDSSLDLSGIKWTDAL